MTVLSILLAFLMKADLYHPAFHDFSPSLQALDMTGFFETV